MSNKQSNVNKRLFILLEAYTHEHATSTKVTRTRSVVIDRPMLRSLVVLGGHGGRDLGESLQHGLDQADREVHAEDRIGTLLALHLLAQLSRESLLLRGSPEI